MLQTNNVKLIFATLQIAEGDGNVAETQTETSNIVMGDNAMDDGGVEDMTISENVDSPLEVVYSDDEMVTDLDENKPDAESPGENSKDTTEANKLGESEPVDKDMKEELSEMEVELNDDKESTEEPVEVNSADLSEQTKNDISKSESGAADAASSEKTDKHDVALLNETADTDDNSVNKEKGDVTESENIAKQDDANLVENPETQRDIDTENKSDKQLTEGSLEKEEAPVHIVDLAKVKTEKVEECKSSVSMQSSVITPVYF